MNFNCEKQNNLCKFLLAWALVFTSADCQTKFGNGHFDTVKRMLILEDSLPFYPLVPINKSYFEILGGGRNLICVDEIQSNFEGKVQRYNLFDLDTNKVILLRKKQVLLRSSFRGDVFGMFHYDYRKNSESKYVEIALYPNGMKSCVPKILTNEIDQKRRLSSISISRVFDCEGISLFVGANYSLNGKIFSVTTVMTKNGQAYYGEPPIKFQNVSTSPSSLYLNLESIQKLAGIPDSILVDQFKLLKVELNKTIIPSAEDLVYQFYASGHVIQINSLSDGKVKKFVVEMIPTTKMDSALEKIDLERFNTSWLHK